MQGRKSKGEGGGGKGKKVGDFGSGRSYNLVLFVLVLIHAKPSFVINFA